MIYVKGGGWCSSAGTDSGNQDCRNRFTNFAWPSTLPESYLLPMFRRDNPTNGALMEAGVAYLWYCTGDTHSGDYAGGGVYDNLEFRGKTVVHAMLRHLQNSNRIRANLILSGCSAGARGLMYSEHWLRKILHSEFSIDSPKFWYLSPFAVVDDTNVKRAVENLKLIEAMENDDPCLLHFGTVDAWECFQPLVKIQFLNTSQSLITTSILDSMRDAMDLGEYKDAVLQATSTMSRYLTDCDNHCLVRSGYFTECEGTKQALSLLMQGETLDVKSDGLTTCDCANECIASSDYMACKSISGGVIEFPVESELPVDSVTPIDIDLTGSGCTITVTLFTVVAFIFGLLTLWGLFLNVFGRLVPWRTGIEMTSYGRREK